MAPPLSTDNPQIPPMELRDLFAAFAAVRLDPEVSGSPAAFAHDCYELADALLAYRVGAS